MYIHLHEFAFEIMSLLSDHKRVYWYNCDDLDDRGWGCGWRVMQTVSSLLFDEQVSIAQIDETLTSMGFDTRTNDGKDGSQSSSGRLAFADLGWISEYFRIKYCPEALYSSSTTTTTSSVSDPVEIKLYAPKDIPALRLSLREMKETSRLGDQVVVLVCGGMIVCIDGIGREGIDGGETVCHFVDPHVYETPQDGRMPPLTVPGKGGIGYYCVVKLMEDLVKPLYEDLCAGGDVEDESIIALREEIKASALDYVSPCFLAITKVSRHTG